MKFNDNDHLDDDDYEDDNSFLKRKNINKLIWFTLVYFVYFINKTKQTNKHNIYYDYLLPVESYNDLLQIKMT